MAGWMALRKRWDGAIAKRAKLGRTLTPAASKAYQAFLDAPYRKVVFDLKNRTHVPKPSAVGSASLKDCLVAELKMHLDPGHLSLRFGDGPFYHLMVRQFEVAEASGGLYRGCGVKCRVHLWFGCQLAYVLRKVRKEWI